MIEKYTSKSFDSWNSIFNSRALSQCFLKNMESLEIKGNLEQFLNPSGNSVGISKIRLDKQMFSVNLLLEQHHGETGVKVFGYWSLCVKGFSCDNT